MLPFKLLFGFSEIKLIIPKRARRQYLFEKEQLKFFFFFLFLVESKTWRKNKLPNFPSLSLMVVIYCLLSTEVIWWYPEDFGYGLLSTKTFNNWRETEKKKDSHRKVFFRLVGLWKMTVRFLFREILFRRNVWI